MSQQQQPVQQPRVMVQQQAPLQQQYQGQQQSELPQAAYRGGELWKLQCVLLRNLLRNLTQQQVVIPELCTWRRRHCGAHDHAAVPA
jgi:hypothetical protein